MKIILMLTVLLTAGQIRAQTPSESADGEFAAAKTELFNAEGKALTQIKIRESSESIANREFESLLQADQLIMDFAQHECLAKTLRDGFIGGTGQNVAILECETEIIHDRAQLLLKMYLSK